MKEKWYVLFWVIFVFCLVGRAFAMESPQRLEFQGRKGWKLENDKVEIIALEGGGHIVYAGLKSQGDSGVNPYWVPHWKSMEPAQFDAEKHAPIFGKNNEAKLLASIMGHNICLDFFGVPSEAEYEYGGITVHGEAPVVPWKEVRTWGNEEETGLIYEGKLPESQLVIRRTLVLRKNEPVLRIKEELTNKGSFDRPIGWCQHVTFGAPFVEKGVTFFDFPSGRGAVAPFAFSNDMRYEKGKEYRWPYIPGSSGELINARFAAAEDKSSDYTANLLDRNLNYGYFTAVNPRKDLMVGYVWDNKLFPWLDNWEENHARTHKPWNGNEMTRGMEFSTTPWTYTRKETVRQGAFFDTSTYEWIGAGKTITTEYFAFYISPPENFIGTEMLKLDRNSIEIEGKSGEKITVPCREINNVFK
ncbi:MAG: DUF4432 family protein [Vulcanimicrobiota bacterium]